jgi:hypothetical protein
MMDINALENDVARAQANVDSALTRMLERGFIDLPRDTQAYMRANLATSLAHKDFALHLLDEAKDINARIINGE